MTPVYCPTTSEFTNNIGTSNLTPLSPLNLATNNDCFALGERFTSQSSGFTPEQLKSSGSSPCDAQKSTK